MPIPKNFQAVALQLANKSPYQRNLDALLSYIHNNPDTKLIVAPEVCLSDYDYENIDKAVDFSLQAIEKIKEITDNQIVVLTVLSKSGTSYSNDAIVIHKHEVVHRQSKHKLFPLGEEQKYLNSGEKDGIKLFEIDGVKYGIMICFELRFKELWSKLDGADIILVPSQWGISRKSHLEALSKALAIINQCYVIVANSSKEDMASSSGIYSPSGGVVADDMQKEISAEIDFILIRKMRKYINMH